MKSRRRAISPSFFINDEIAELAPLERLFFIGLWTVADRAGRLEYRPKQLKVVLLPFDEFDVPKAVDNLAKKGFLLVYKVDSELLIEIQNFEKHQIFHPKESSSSLPDSCKHHATVMHDSCMKKSGMLYDDKVTDLVNDQIQDPIKIPDPEKLQISSPVKSSRKLKARDGSALERPLWAKCHALRLNPNEYEKVKRAFAKKNFPAELLEAVIFEVDLWLSGETEGGKKARNTHTYRTLYASWAIKKGFERIEVMRRGRGASNAGWYSPSKLPAHQLFKSQRNVEGANKSVNNLITQTAGRLDKTEDKKQ